MRFLLPSGTAVAVVEADVDPVPMPPASPVPGGGAAPVVPPPVVPGTASPPEEPGCGNEPLTPEGPAPELVSGA